jgi:thiamine-monophosphate kinase
MLGWLLVSPVSYAERLSIIPQRTLGCPRDTGMVSREGRGVLAGTDFGEFELIDRVAAVLGRPGDAQLLVGIGDDAAAWSPSPESITVATTDALVDGVHFDLHTTTWRDLGWKAMAENVSDVAAMGCRPRYALIALALPASIAAQSIDELYRGVADCARTYGFAVVGGDVVRSPSLVLHVTLLGESEPMGSAQTEKPLLVRSAARVGDVIAVTGPLGGSAAGLRLLVDESVLPSSDAAGPEATCLTEAAAALRAAHRHPVPRVAAGLALVAAGVRCALDVSDGLVADIGHICEQSGVDAELALERIPVSTPAETLFGDAARDLALTGGEDYELVCTGAEDVLARAGEMLVERGEPPLIMIGRVTPRSGARPEVRLIGPDGGTSVLERGGYQHFEHGSGG